MRPLPIKMSYTYQVAELFSQAFGSRLPFVVDSEIVLGNPSLKFPEASVKKLPEPEGYSPIGTPIVSLVTFKGQQYNIFDNNGVITQKKMEDYHLPPTTLVDCSRGKIINKTTVSGGTASVKEIFSFDDWVIRMRGLCLTTPDKTALEHYEDLLQWEEIVDSIEVVGKVFTARKIYRITINNIDDRQLAMRPNVVPFEMSCWSDEPLELIL